MAGCNAVWAANHWQIAVKIHVAKHPGGEHVCQNLHQANWAAFPTHDILPVSPCCQGHSRARGKANGNPA
jgi:DNA (cytosine-5)-methyltransferase 1